MSLIAATITLLFGVVGVASATEGDHWNTKACTPLADLAAHFDEDRIPSAAIPAVGRRSGSIDVIAVGFNGGVVRRVAPTSGAATLSGRIQSLGGERVATLALSHRRWAEAARQVIRLVEAERKSSGRLRPPSIVVYGHSLGAGSIDRFARRLHGAGLEITLAVYIDAVGWQNPRVPDNVRCAIDFYQRGGVLKGLPVRGKRELIALSPADTAILGSYAVRSWSGWRKPDPWKPLRRLLFEHHHFIVHHPRVQAYILSAVAIILNLAP